MKQLISAKFNFVLVILCLMFSTQIVFSQNKKLNKRVAKTKIIKKGKPKKPTVQPLLEPVYKSGDVYVNVRSMTDRTIRLGLSPGGVTLVEFPTNDFIFARHPGDEDFVTLDKDMVARNNPSDPLVFRPGKGFVVTKENRAATQITIQMTSGAVFTFQIYPVQDLGKSATRVQLIYNPNEIMSERERIGLPTYLQIKREAPLKRPGEEVQEEISKETKNAEETEKKANGKETELEQSEQIDFPQEVLDEVKSLSSAEDFAKTLVDEAALYKWKFGNAKNGLSLASQKSILIEKTKYRLELIAVKNNLKESISLVDLPQLVIETYEKKGGKGNALNQEFYPIKSIITNLGNDKLLAPNSTYYFAVIADYPITLGVQQELKISLAQTNAADDPVSLNLLTTAR